MWQVKIFKPNAASCRNCSLWAIPVEPERVKGCAFCIAVPGTDICMESCGWPRPAPSPGRGAIASFHEGLENDINVWLRAHPKISEIDPYQIEHEGALILTIFYRE
ncbi:MAG: hypothetical protein PHE59_05115 [Patescibacteria group bacterium]|nr:hypothetical protein [Patescibacteria group bacterium]